jgi:hypothetical protein
MDRVLMVPWWGQFAVWFASHAVMLHCMPVNRSRRICRYGRMFSLGWGMFFDNVFEPWSPVGVNKFTVRV